MPICAWTPEQPEFVRISLADGKIETVAQDPDYDIEGFGLDAASDELDYYVTGDPDPDRPSIRFVNAGDKERLAYLNSILPRGILGVARAPKKDIWLVFLASDREPGAAVLFDWRTKSVIGSLYRRGFRMSDGDRHRLATTRVVRIPARDGLKLDAFLTVPPAADAISAAPRAPVPLIVYLHGGPFMETDGRYDGIVQLLANRGYGVLQFNYRGSSGRGSAFEASASQVLAGQAVDDVVDTLNWAVGEGYAVRVASPFLARASEVTSQLPLLSANPEKQPASSPGAAYTTSWRSRSKIKDRSILL